MVEGDHALGLQIALGLESGGAWCCAPGSCAEATLNLVACGWDIVVADVDLPRDDGYALAGIARSLTLPPSCIALSRRGGPVDVERAKQAGFALLLSKPLAPGVLAFAARLLRGSLLG